MSNTETKMVRVAIDKDGILIRAGDPQYTTKDIDKELLKIIKEGGEVKNITYEEFSRMKMYEKNA